MVTLNDARKVIAAAERKAAETGQPMNIAVVDGGGNLVAHARMDRAWLGSIDISINKAFTSRAFDIATGIWQSSPNQVRSFTAFMSPTPWSELCARRCNCGTSASAC
jgi:uncharacterized protein GlcG (DUF336 family)